MEQKKEPASKVVGDMTKRHPIARENLPEETIRRMRKVKERIAKFRETIHDSKQFSD